MDKHLFLSIFFFSPLFKKRRNFSLVARYSLKFTRFSLLVVKSLVTRCKIRSLLVAEVARCKKSLVTRCKICSLLVGEVAPYKKSLVARCEIPSVLIAKNHSSLKQSPAGIIVCLKSTKLDESFSFFNINYYLGKIYKWIKSEQLLALSQGNE